MWGCLGIDIMNRHFQHYQCTPLLRQPMDPKNPRSRGPPGCFTFFIPKKLKLSYLRVELGAALPMDRSLVDLLGFAWAVALDLSLVDCIKVLKNVRVDLE